LVKFSLHFDALPGADPARISV